MKPSPAALALAGKLIKRSRQWTEFGTTPSDIAECATLIDESNKPLVEACDSAAQQAQYIVDDHDRLKSKGNELQVCAIQIRDTLDVALQNHQPKE